MKRMNARGMVLGIILAALLPISMTGCAGRHPAGTQPPEWVTKGSGAFKDSGSKVFYGVGSVIGVRNPPLARTTAENRARAEITKIFETYTASLMKDYAASTTGGGAVTGASATSEEQYVEQAIKTFSSATLNGVMIIDHWTDSSTGELFALARLDLESFKNSLDKIKELNSAVRDYVKKNAEKSFEGLAAEEEKRAK